METDIEQVELFPFLGSVQKAERSPFRQWLEATKNHGPLMTSFLAASALGVSRQRVHQFVQEGRLATVDVTGQRMIPAASLDLFMSEERGRGVQPKNKKKGLLRCMFSEANKLADEITA